MHCSAKVMVNKNAGGGIKLSLEVFIFFSGHALAIKKKAGFTKECPWWSKNILKLNPRPLVHIVTICYVVKRELHMKHCHVLKYNGILEVQWNPWRKALHRCLSCKWITNFTWKNNWLASLGYMIHFFSKMNKRAWHFKENNYTYLLQ